MRTVGSTLVGQALDTAIFVTLAFAGTVPGGVLTGIIVAQCRIFAESHEHDAELAVALERALGEEPPSIATNV